MRVFVTGATGFIGRAVVQDLLAHNHTVLGLARNDASATKLRQAGADAFPGDIEDLDSLRRGAEAADGIIHLAFILDPSDFTRGVAKDKEAIVAMAESIRGTDKPLVFASGTMVLGSRRMMTEDDEAEWSSPFSSRAKVDVAVKEMGVRGMTMRLPPSVHGDGDQGLVAMIVGAGKKNGAVIYVGDGKQRWPAVHRDDAAVAFRLALEKGRAGAVYHAVAEGGIEIKEIAESAAKGLKVPAESRPAEEAQKTLGFLAFTIQRDHEVSSEKTKRELGWGPQGLGLLEDMETNYYA